MIFQILCNNPQNSPEFILQICEIIFKNFGYTSGDISPNFPKLSEKILQIFQNKSISRIFLKWFWKISDIIFKILLNYSANSL